MNKILKYMSFSLAACALFVSTAASAGHPTTSKVTVTLWNKGVEVAMSTKLAYPNMSKSKATMGITAVPSSVPAGEVTFKAINSSKVLVHEMIVIRLAHPGQPLPYIKNENRVDEDKAGAIGEVSELDPGKSGTLTLHLKPGEYLLICNVPGHYASGMWTKFTVR